MATLMAVPRGIISGADVVLTVVFVGGAFALLEATGALSRLIGALVGHTRRPKVRAGRGEPAVATLGASRTVRKELVALVPVLVVLSRGLVSVP